MRAQFTSSVKLPRIPITLVNTKSALSRTAPALVCTAVWKLPYFVDSIFAVWNCYLANVVGLKKHANLMRKLFANVIGMRAAKVRLNKNKTATRVPFATTTPNTLLK